MLVTSAKSVKTLTATNCSLVTANLYLYKQSLISILQRMIYSSGLFVKASQATQATETAVKINQITNNKPIY